MSDHKKVKGAIVLLGLACVLGTSGTFAWTSISQKALNEGYAVQVPGGRVHDDYEGFDKIVPTKGGRVNKDIYVENYSNKPLYVRIKLSEYMELGEGAGDYTVSGESHQMVATADNQAVTPEHAGLEGARLDDRSTWPVYLPQGLLPNGEPSAIRKYIVWSLGDRNERPKVYMPTFNQNNQSLESDVTGEAIDEWTWSKNHNYDTTVKKLPGTQDEWSLGEKHKSTLRTYDEKSNEEIQTPDIEHIATETVVPEQTHGYMTMDEWQASGQPVGNFWIHDNDGWCYWAAPLNSHTATSLLLDYLDVVFPNEDMYYAINVSSDLATSEDIDKWENVSVNAKELLKKIQ